MAVAAASAAAIRPRRRGPTRTAPAAPSAAGRHRTRSAGRSGCAAAGRAGPAAPERVDEPEVGDLHRHRVDGEVAPGEVVLDRRAVDHLGVAGAGRVGVRPERGDLDPPRVGDGPARCSRWQLTVPNSAPVSHTAVAQGRTMPFGLLRRRRGGEVEVHLGEPRDVAGGEQGVADGAHRRGTARGRRRRSGRRARAPRGTRRRGRRARRPGRGSGRRRSGRPVRRGRGEVELGGRG